MNASPWGRVRGMIAVSMCDWPGRVSCVLFSAGCNLRCPTCHNAALAWDWRALPVLEREIVLADLRRRRHWLDGITLSGGEPTLLAGLPDLLADLAGTGLPVKLDSNGTAPEILELILREGLARTVAVDVKGPWELYPELTGESLRSEDARACLDQVFDLARVYAGRIYFRCTKVPRLAPVDLERTRAQVPQELELRFQDFVPPRNDDCESVRPMY